MARLASALLVATALAAASGCAPGPRAPASRPPSGTGSDAAREVLERFARALEAGRFEEAHALLSSRWRAAYTPGRLALDFGGAAAARGAAAGVLARLAAGEALERTEAGARLPAGAGRAAVLVVEAGGWRVDALE